MTMLNLPKPVRPIVIFGFDVGQGGDPPAVAATERIAGRPARYVMGHVERLPLQQEYDDQVQHVWDIVTHPTATVSGGVPMKETRRFILVDATGCGRAVPEMFNRRLALNPADVELVSLVAITTIATAGAEMTVAKGYPWRWWCVSKRDIVTALAMVVLGGRFEVPPSVGAVHWRQEMKTFDRGLRQKWETYEAELEGQHAGTVMASALTCWYGENVLGKLGVRRRRRARR